MTMYSQEYDEGLYATMADKLGKLKKQEIANTYKLGKSEIAARLKIASQSSKDTRFGIEQERDAARERVEQARQEMLRIGIPQMEINRFVAESTAEIARQELGLKREIFLAESGLARDQLAKDIREMEEIGIPRVEIERYTAEKQAELGQLEYGLKRDAFVEQQRQYGIDFNEARRQFDTTHAEEARQFNVTQSGYMQTGGQLSQPEQARMNQIQARDDALRAAGQPGVGGDDLLELQRYQTQLSSGGGQQRTLQGEELDRQYALDVQQFGADEAERRRRYALDVQRFGADEAERRRVEDERQRRFGLDVGKFGAELASTPDTYFQARRFQGVDVPRLMGGAGAATQDVQGGPTPGVATMGAYLGGQDPYGGGGGPSWAGTSYPAGTTSPYGGAGIQYGEPPPGGSVGPGQGAPDRGYTQGPESLGMPGTPEDDRYKQVQGIARLSPPSPYDGLNEQDTSTLKLMESIYKRGGQNIAGGEYERLAATGRLGYLQSAGKLLGYDPKGLENEYLSYRPTQESGRLA